jgi:hypothetical protein
VAGVAAGSEVIQIQAQLRAVRDRHDVIAVEVAQAVVAAVSQFGKDLRSLGHADVMGAVEPDHVRFPAAVDAGPVIPLEANHAKDAMVLVIASLLRRTALPVMGMDRTSAAATDQRRATGSSAGPRR